VPEALPQEEVGVDSQDQPLLPTTYADPFTEVNQRLDLRRALYQLNTYELVLLTLRYIDEYTLAELAKMLDLSITRVHIDIQQILKKLRRILSL